MIDETRLEQEVDDELDAVLGMLQGKKVESRFIDNETVVTSSTGACERREWAKQWASKSAVYYLKLLLKQEMPDLVNGGKVNVVMAANRLGIDAQVLYRVFRGLGPSLDVLAGIAAKLGYAVEVRFVSTQEAMDHEVLVHRLTLEGEVEW